MRAWERFAADPGDDADATAEKVTALIVAGACSIAGIGWSAMYLVVFGWGRVAALPLLFAGIVGSALVVSHVTRDLRPAVVTQIVCIIGITTAISWSIGSAFDSGVVMLWAFLGPVTALLFFSRRVAVGWFVVFLVAVALTVGLEPSLADGGLSVSDDTRLAFFGLNLTVASTVLFLFAGYFVRQAVGERERANALLHNMLPAGIAPRLKASDATIADSFDEASVLFADMVGSTPLFADLDPVEAVDWLNEVFSLFDALTEAHGLEKIRTIGDSYMVTAGAPVHRDDHADAICRLALDMVECLDTLAPRGGRRLEFRLGINSGPLVGGVIGSHRYHYDVWGDTVNVAARMESHGEVGRVHITQATYELLGDGWVCDQRGTIEVKGRGKMATGFLVSAPPLPS